MSASHKGEKFSHRAFFPMLSVFILFAIPFYFPSGIANAGPGGSVVINEIAYGGTTDDSSYEWVELYNYGTSDVDLNGWRFTDGNNVNHTFDSTHPNTNTRIVAGGFLLLEWDENAVPGYSADQIVTNGDLNDFRPAEELWLLDETGGSSTVVDYVDNTSDEWYAGFYRNYSQYISFPMSRIDPLVSSTVSDNWMDSPFEGTPGLPNDFLNICGNGIIERWEQCDDGNRISGDGCTGTCEDEGQMMAPIEIQNYFNEVKKRDYPTPFGSDYMERALINEIDNAKYSIDAAIYGFNRENILNSLIMAKQRGVRVRVVTEEDQYTSTRYGSFFSDLENEGIPVRHDSDSFALHHNKFFVIDRKKVWTGSTNITDIGFTYNKNNSILLDSWVLARDFSKEFEGNLWSNTFGVAKSKNPMNVYNFGGETFELCFSPTGSCEHEIMKELRHADESVHILANSFTSKRIADLLIVLNDIGIDVKVAADSAGADPATATGAVVPYLCDAGVPVKIEDWGGKLHDKVIVIDGVSPNSTKDSVVITGALNWTNGGAFKNDENTEIIHNMEIIDSYEENFQSVYNDISDTWFCNNPGAESPNSGNSCADGYDNDHDDLLDSLDPDCASYYP